MSYSNHFTLVDDFLMHLDSLMTNIQDPFIQNRYLGFIVTAAVTAYELAIKEIFFEFSDRKHRLLGSVARHRFDRMNGQISLSDLKNKHVKMFGDKYVDKFKRKLDEVEQESLRNRKGSPQSSYGNILVWRHNFVHRGEFPNTTNYPEIRKSYELGKQVIVCLHAAMRR